MCTGRNRRCSYNEYGGGLFYRVVCGRIFPGSIVQCHRNDCYEDWLSAYQHCRFSCGDSRGASDILTPVVTGFLVGKLGVGIAFPYAMLMTVISIVGL